MGSFFAVLGNTTSCHPVTIECTYQVGGPDEEQVQAGVLDPGRHVLLLHLLEIELRENVEPVGDL